MFKQLKECFEMSLPKLAKTLLKLQRDFYFNDDSFKKSQPKIKYYIKRFDDSNYPQYHKWLQSEGNYELLDQLWNDNIKYIGVGIKTPTPQSKPVNKTLPVPPHPIVRFALNIIPIKKSADEDAILGYAIECETNFETKYPAFVNGIKFNPQTGYPELIISQYKGFVQGLKNIELTQTDSEIKIANLPTGQDHLVFKTYSGCQKAAGFINLLLLNHQVLINLSSLKS